jgi:predicted transposase YbfD/YdcC
LTTIDKAHGRIETRSIQVARPPRWLNFPHVKQVAKVTRTRELKGKVEQESVFLISSLAVYKASPERLLELNRGHWGIENCVHYVRDVSLDEDRRYHRKNPAIFASLRNFAITICRLLLSLR